ncbi:MAG: aminotransferase class I/II-fold pyridoxal phosphate-dependent enzyme [Fibrobacteres bacterium]|nr:aminotransferase class I/II-fold pyridoxal phosphate-dependent enzyme [Fibrobacterota bacterium]
MFRTLGPHPESRFAHNDYLGLRRDPRLVSGLIRALEAGLPLTSSGSRLLSGNLDLFTGFESRFARAAGFPAALVFASTSEANRAAICALVDRHDVVIHDSLAHASLIDGILHSGAKRKKFAHNDPADLRAQLCEGGGRIRLVVTESVFSMDGDVAPLADLHQVCKEEGALLLVDEAHAVGLFGANRTGLSEGLPKDHTFIASTQGFGKGLASAGGILCTVPAVLERIHNLSRAFIFTTAPSPIAIKAAELAWDLSCADIQRRSQLDALCVQFAEGIQTLGWSLPRREIPTPIFPLLCGGLESAIRASAQLAAQQIFLRPIRPPTVPAGTERLRATVTADLHTSDVDEFLGALRHV